MEFEWDAGKAASNLSKHGISFAEAMTVLNDTLEVMIPDPAHSEAELRFVSIGFPEGGRLSSAQEKPLRGSGDSMSQEVNPEEAEDMLPEYDFTHGRSEERRVGKECRSR